MFVLNFSLSLFKNQSFFYSITTNYGKKNKVFPDFYEEFQFPIEMWVKYRISSVDKTKFSY